MMVRVIMPEPWPPAFRELAALPEPGDVLAIASKAWAVFHTWDSPADGVSRAYVMDVDVEPPPSISARIAALSVDALIAKLVNCAADRIAEYEGADGAVVRAAIVARMAELGIATLEHGAVCAAERPGYCGAECAWRAGGPR